MRPLPPELAEAAAEWEVNEVFWLAKHGVRLSGMPVFGETHGDQALWNIAAFVKQLPALTPEEYEAIGSPGRIDMEYMKATIPHHSIAIMTSKRAQISDQRVRKFADEIVEAQEREIAEMKYLVTDLEERDGRCGPAGWLQPQRCCRRRRQFPRRFVNDP